MSFFTTPYASSVVSIAFWVPCIITSTFPGSQIPFVVSLVDDLRRGVHVGVTRAQIKRGAVILLPFCADRATQRGYNRLKGLKNYVSIQRWEDASHPPIGTHWSAALGESQQLCQGSLLYCFTFTDGISQVANWTLRVEGRGCIVNR